MLNKERTIGFQVRTLDNLIKRRTLIGCLENESGITQMQGWVIGYVYENQDRDIFQRDVEAEFSIRRSTATAVLQLMEKNGYIRRIPVLHDLRLKKIVLTDKAIEHQRAVTHRIETEEARMIQGISRAELDGFYNTIAKIKANLEKPD